VAQLAQINCRAGLKRDRYGPSVHRSTVPTRPVLRDEHGCVPALPRQNREMACVMRSHDYHSFIHCHLSILTRGHAIMRFMTPHEHSRTPLSRSGSAPPRIEPDKMAWPGSKRSETTARAKLQEPKGGGLFGTGASRPVRCTRRCGLSSPATIPYPSRSSPIRSDKR
jgi:hypothetical protein